MCVMLQIRTPQVAFAFSRDIHLNRLEFVEQFNGYELSRS